MTSRNRSQFSIALLLGSTWLWSDACGGRTVGDGPPTVGDSQTGSATGSGSGTAGSSTSTTAGSGTTVGSGTTGAGGWGPATSTSATGATTGSGPSTGIGTTGAGGAAGWGPGPTSGTGGMAGGRPSTGVGGFGGISGTAGFGGRGSGGKAGGLGKGGAGGSFGKGGAGGTFGKAGAGGAAGGPPCPGVTCPPITCPSGYQPTILPGVCCPVCIADPNACATGQKAYYDYRAVLLQKADSVICMTDKDCTLRYENNRCASGCGFSVPLVIAESVDQNLRANATTNCSTCPPPIPTPCPAMFAACQQNRCVTTLTPQP